jgi:hypothetical protein
MLFFLIFGNFGEFSGGFSGEFFAILIIITDYIYTYGTIFFKKLIIITDYVYSITLKIVEYIYQVFLGITNW